MNKRLHTMAILPALMCLLVAIACAGRDVDRDGWTVLTPASANDAAVIRIVGTVRHVDVEGGEYVIVDDKDTRFNPTNLPREFQIDGTAVEADARRRERTVSIGMVGPIVDLVRIRHLSLP
jgi:hypothetical protein